MTRHPILEKLEAFIRKYYKNQLLKGGILLVSLLAFGFFILAFAEYFGRYSTAVRTTFAVLYLGSSLVALVVYIVRPLLGLLDVSRSFGYEEASLMVGRHFPEVGDKILNTIQLHHNAISQRDNQLLMASIEQRTLELTPIPFVSAISFKTNLRYVKLALFPALALILILLVSPGFKESGVRVMQFNKHFEISAPFDFNTNIGLNQQVVQNQDLPVELKLDGDAIPADAYLVVDGQRFKMRRNTPGIFEFTLKNIQRDKEVYFDAAGFTSKQHDINVVLRPSLLGYEAHLRYPTYLQRSSERLNNITRLEIPQGTVIEWKFNTRNVSQLKLDQDDIAVKTDGNSSVFEHRFMRSKQLRLNTSNNEVEQGDSLQLNIEVIPDQFPMISAQKMEDSASRKILYFMGDVTDDHGFTDLTFHYRFTQSDNATKLNSEGSVDIPINLEVQHQKFYHYWNLETIGFELNDEIEYHFTIRDNDGVNGAKTTRTAAYTYKAPSKEQIEEETEKANDAIKGDMATAQEKATQLQQDIQKVERMLTEKKQLDWNDKQRIQQLLDQQKKLEDQIRKSIEQNKEKNAKEQEFNPVQEEIMNKQKELEKLLDEVLDEETRALMEKIQELLQENNKEELQQALEEFKFSEKEMSKEMDRMLELFKSLELEKKLSETIEKAQKLAEEQKDLSDKTKEGNSSDQELKDKQDELQKKMNDLKKDLDDIKEKNSDLESPLPLDDQQEKGESISNDMEGASEQLEKGKQRQAQEQMDDAAEKLKEMAEKMQENMEEAYKEQQEEDLASLRQILENLIQLSKDQEDLIDGFKANMRYSPKYVQLRQQQQKIKNETRLVEDSLLALSKRNMEISQYINKEIGDVNESLDRSLKHLGERQTGNALIHQQYAMTGYNNLALMLSQIMQQMQQQMKNKGKPNEQCNKPGSGQNGKNKKPNAKSLKQMQDELAKQLQQLKQGQSQGKQPSSKEFARIAAEQEAIRRKLQDLENQLKKEGKGGSLGDLKKTQDMMDQLERDLYYKRLDNATFQKLDQIQIKLSEHERAEREQEIDNKRSSEEGKQIDRKLPPAIQEYLDAKEKETELLQQVSPELKSYYRKKVKSYFAD